MTPNGGIADAGTLGGDQPPSDPSGALGVFRNPAFLRLWLSQAATQIGGNMVLFGLTVIVSATQPNTAVSLLILSFLVPAVLFSAVAGVYVDRVDRRLMLIATNVLRGIAIVGLFLVGDHFLLLLLLNIFVSTVTVFFAPAEAAMIPEVVPRRQLLAANGVFTLTLNAAFAVGFALLGPLVINIAGAPAVILVVAALYFLAAAFCWTLPPSPPPVSAATAEGPHPVGETRHAIETTLAQLREGLDFIRGHRSIGWSLLYLGITASLVGVLGVLGPDFAETALGLEPKDFAVVVLPLGGGIVMGILLLNAYGKYLPRRRVIEGGLITLGIMLSLLSVAGPISRFLQGEAEILPSALTSLLSVVVFIAFIAGIAYAGVAIPSQTQLQEDLPEDVRGRVFGVLNMLVSVSSFLPIIIVGPISDVIPGGTPTVMLLVAVAVLIAGIASVIRRNPNLGIPGAKADPHAEDPIAAALGADLPRWREDAAPASDLADRPEPGPAPIAPTAPTPPPPPVAPESGVADPDATAVVDRPGPGDPADRD